MPKGMVHQEVLVGAPVREGTHRGIRYSNYILRVSVIFFYLK